MPIYVGIEGKARKIKVGYAGDINGNAKVIYKEGIVPSGYIPVQYIFNDHANLNSINTTILCNTYTRIVCKISYGPNQIVSDTAQIIGDSKFKMNIYRFYEYNHPNNVSVNIDGTSQTVTMQNSTIHTFDLNRNANKETYYDNTLLFTNTSTYSSEGGIRILGQSALRDVRIHSCAIYHSMLNGILTRNYIPCIRIADGRVGMWETVEGKFEAGSNATSQYSNGPIITS